MKWFIVTIAMIQGQQQPLAFIYHTPFSSLAECEAVRRTSYNDPGMRAICAGNEEVARAIIALGKSK